MKIAVTGSMAFDYIMSFSGNFTDYILPDQLEHLSVSFLVDSMRRERGGTAGNIAYNLALLNQPTLLMASVGQDAREYVAALADIDIDVSGILHLTDEFTASFFVSTDQNNRQIANFYIGAMAKAPEVSFHQQDHANIQVATISPNAPQAMTQYVTECKDLGVKYLYDPSQQIPLLTVEDLTAGIDGAYMFVVNDYEFELIKQRTKLSLGDIRAMTGTLVITQGEDGSTIYTDGTSIHIPALSNLDVADPTGAGDAYRSGLLAAHLNHLDWLETGQLATLTATYALEEHGTQKHHYTIAQFAERYANKFELTRGVEQFFNSFAN